jgi:hypothetical protein
MACNSCNMGTFTPASNWNSSLKPGNWNPYPELTSKKDCGWNNTQPNIPNFSQQENFKINPHSPWNPSSVVNEGFSSYSKLPERSCGSGLAPRGNIEGFCSDTKQPYEEVYNGKKACCDQQVPYKRINEIYTYNETCFNT